MAEWLNPAKEPAMLSLQHTGEACDRTDSHLKKVSNPEDTTVVQADISHHQTAGPGLSEREVQHVPDKGGIVIQYIHFSVDKNGCLE
jgi:hypothetical protein